MCNWKKWFWPGILTVGLLTALALFMKQNVIETDLKAKAVAALGAQGQGWAQVEMSGRDATLLGSAPSEESQSAAALLTDQAYDVRVVDNRTDLIAAQSPYVVTAKRDGEALELTGFVPNEATRAEILESAAKEIPGAKVTDKMTLARGAPEGLAAIAGFGLSQLKGLTTGEMSLSDTDLSVKGAASDFDVYNGVNSALDGALPAGAKLAMKDITPPSVSPYTWSADYDGSGVTLGGYAPSAAVSQQIEDKAKSILPSATVTNNMVVAGGAPAEFAKNAMFGLEQLPRFSNGSVGTSDIDLSVRGVALDSGKYAMAKGAVGGALPAGLKLASEQIVPSTVSPYPWAADYDGKTTTLTGFAPDAATKQAIVSSAKDQLGGEVVDQMQIAAGAPADFTAGTSFALAQLPRFSSGNVSMSDTNLTVSGVARDSQKFDIAKAAVAGALPAGMALASEKISPSTVSPYRWAAAYDGQSTTLTGFVPDNAARGAIVADAKAQIGDNVVDEMQIAAGSSADFQAQTKFALAQLSRFSSGEVSLSDEDLTVSGVALDSDKYDMAKAAVGEALPAGLKLASEGIVPSTVSPYTWGANYNGRSVALTGFVPDSETRSAIVENTKAKLPGVEVTDTMQTAAGAPADFKNATRFAIAQLPRFVRGSASLSDSNLSVVGAAKDAANYDGAKAALAGNLPAGIKLASERIFPAPVSPYNWSANYNGKIVTLEGLVPSEDARGKVLAAVKDKLPKAKVVDNMNVAIGAPAAYGANTASAIALLPRFSSGSASLTDSDLTVMGKAKTKNDFDVATKTVNGALGGSLKLAKADIQPAPPPKDYTWMAQRTASSIVLSGFAPSKADRLSIAKRVKALHPGKTVVNRMIPRSDAPAGFQSNVDRGVNLLGRLSAGKASIVNKSMSIEGQASSVNNYDAALDDAASDLTFGYKWNVRDIKPVRMSPYTWALVKGGDTAEQSGFVPSRGTGNSLVGATTATLGKPVNDTQRVASGEPENFTNAVSSAISAVNTLDSSRASITDTNMFVQGRADSEADASRIEDEIRSSIPSNYKLRALISYPLPKVVVVAAKQCEVDFAEMLADEKIRFATNRALIKSESHGLLDKLAEAAKNCPEAKFEVGGHTDSRGREAYNQQLSEARAQAVIDYLSNAGVTGGNFMAKGYGELAPIGDNKTAEGRAENRRIEIKVLEN